MVGNVMQQAMVSSMRSMARNAGMRETSVPADRVDDAIALLRSRASAEGKELRLMELPDAGYFAIVVVNKDTPKFLSK